MTITNSSSGLMSVAEEAMLVDYIPFFHLRAEVTVVDKMLIKVVNKSFRLLAHMCRRLAR